MIRFKMIVGALALAVGLVLGGAPPVSAHTQPSDQHFDTNSFFYCGLTRPNTDYTVQYDWPYHISPEYTGYTCIAHNHGASSGGTRWVCSWVVLVWWNGAVTNPTSQQHCSVW